MAERDGAAADIHLLVRQAKFVFAVYGHGGESFVQLDDVNVADAEVEFRQQLWDGDAGPNAHDPGCEAGDGGADEFAEDGLSEFDGTGALHQEDSGG
jgi:hypothetical protein